MVSLHRILALRVLRILKDNPKKVALMLLLDLAFIASFTVLLALFGLLFPESLRSYVGSGAAPSSQLALILSGVLLALVLLLALLVLAYSAAKNAMIKLIASLFEKTEISAKGTFRMFTTNLVAFVALLIILLLILIVLPLVAKKTALGIFGAMSIAAYLFFSIAFVNAAHSLLPYEKHPLKKALSFAFRNIRSYVTIYVYDIILIIAAIILIIVLSLLLSFFSQSSIILGFLNMLAIILALFIVSFNRICFFVVVNKKHESRKEV